MQKTNKTLRLCVNAVMIALFVVLDVISPTIGNNIKITFGGFPIIICAILFGPIDGMTVGLLGSFIGQLIKYGLSVTTPLWIIPAAVRGILMGILFKAFNKSKKPQILTLEIIISSLTVTALNTVITYLDSLIWNYPFTATLYTLFFRIVSSVITAIVYAALVSVIIRVLDRYEKK